MAPYPTREEIARVLMQRIHREVWDVIDGGSLRVMRQEQTANIRTKYLVDADAILALFPPLAEVEAP